MRQSLHLIVEKFNLPWQDYSRYSMADTYCCPITVWLIQTPVIDPEGNTFEQDAIKTWLLKNGTSPITRTLVNVLDLYPNYVMAELTHLMCPYMKQGDAADH
jgi:hypothetical protein